MNSGFQSARGYRFEYAAARVFQSQGYLVTVGLPYRFGQNHRDSTDLDVFGIQFAMPFQPLRVLCDCKERVRSRPFERIFWAKGLASFLGMADAYVTLPKGFMELMRFAASGNVRVLTRDALDQALAAAPREPHSLVRNGGYESKKQLVDRALSCSGELKAAYRLAPSLFIVGNCYVDLNVCIDELRITTSRVRALADAGGDQSFVW